jgi:hypothetical protein
MDAKADHLVQDDVAALRRKTRSQHDLALLLEDQVLRYELISIDVALREGVRRQKFEPTL